MEIFHSAGFVSQWRRHVTCTNARNYFFPSSRESGNKHDRFAFLSLGAAWAKIIWIFFRSRSSRAVAWETWAESHNKFTFRINSYMKVEFSTTAGVAQPMRRNLHKNCHTPSASSYKRSQDTRISFCSTQLSIWCFLCFIRAYFSRCVGGNSEKSIFHKPANPNMMNPFLFSPPSGWRFPRHRTRGERMAVMSCN